MDSSYFSISSTTPSMSMDAQASPSPGMPTAIDENARQDSRPMDSGPFVPQAEPFNLMNSWEASCVDTHAMPPPMASIDSLPNCDTSGPPFPFIYEQYRYDDPRITSSQTEGPTAGPAPAHLTISATSNSTSPTSRQRTFQACDKCRDRKTKCSGTKPVCDRCAARGLICHYTMSKDSIRSARRTPSNKRMRSVSYSSVEGAPDLQRYSRPKAAARLSLPYGCPPSATKAGMPSPLAGGAPPISPDSHPAHVFNAATLTNVFRPPDSPSRRPQSSAIDSSSALNFPNFPNFPSSYFAPPGPSYRDSGAAFRPTLHHSDPGASEPPHALERGTGTWAAPPGLAHRPAAGQNMLALLTDDFTLRRHGEHAGYGMPASAPHPEFASPSPFFEEIDRTQRYTP